MTKLPVYVFLEDVRLATLEGDILDAVHETTRDFGLSSVPEAIKYLFSQPHRPFAKRYTIAELPDIHAAMWRLVKQGRLELRPESNIIYQTKEDLSLCPTQIWNGDQKVYYTNCREKKTED